MKMREIDAVVRRCAGSMLREVDELAVRRAAASDHYLVVLQGSGSTSLLVVISGDDIAEGEGAVADRIFEARYVAIEVEIASWLVEEQGRSIDVPAQLVDRVLHLRIRPEVGRPEAEVAIPIGMLANGDPRVIESAITAAIREADRNVQGWSHDAAPGLRAIHLHLDCPHAEASETTAIHESPPPQLDEVQRQRTQRRDELLDRVRSWRSTPMTPSDFHAEVERIVCRFAPEDWLAVVEHLLDTTTETPS